MDLVVSLRNVSLMRALIVVIAGVLFWTQLRGISQEFPSDVSFWQEVAVPPESDRAERKILQLSMDGSGVYWRIREEEGRVVAELKRGVTPMPSDMKFVPKAINPAYDDDYIEIPAVARVKDGWLVAFNSGEFGSALYWYDSTGRRKYEVSDDPVVQFFQRRDGLFAVSSFSHMGTSTGAFLRITYEEDQRKWDTQKVLELPAAVQVGIMKSDESILLLVEESMDFNGERFESTLGSVVSINPESSMAVLLPEVSWPGFRRVNSAVLTNDEKICFGMVQYVGELDLNTGKLRLLIPDKSFIHELPAKEAAQIRQALAPERTAVEDGLQWKSKDPAANSSKER